LSCHNQQLFAMHLAQRRCAKQTDALTSVLRCPPVPVPLLVIGEHWRRRRKLPRTSGSPTGVAADFCLRRVATCRNGINASH